MVLSCGTRACCRYPQITCSYLRSNEQSGYSACLLGCFGDHVTVVKYLIEVVAADWQTEKVRGSNTEVAISVFVWQNRRCDDLFFGTDRVRVASRPYKSLSGVGSQKWWHIWYEVHVPVVVFNLAKHCKVAV